MFFTDRFIAYTEAVYFVYLNSDIGNRFAFDCNALIRTKKHGYLTLSLLFYMKMIVRSVLHRRLDWARPN